MNRLTELAERITNARAFEKGIVAIIIIAVLLGICASPTPERQNGTWIHLLLFQNARVGITIGNSGVGTCHGPRNSLGAAERRGPSPHARNMATVNWQTDTIPVTRETALGERSGESGNGHQAGLPIHST